MIHREKACFTFSSGTFPKEAAHPCIPQFHTTLSLYIVITCICGWVRWQMKDQQYNSKDRWILCWLNSEAIYHAFSLSNTPGHEPSCSLTVTSAVPCKEMPFYHMISQFLPWFWKQHSAKPHLETFTHFCRLTLLYKP